MYRRTLPAALALLLAVAACSEPTNVPEPMADADVSPTSILYQGVADVYTPPPPPTADGLQMAASYGQPVPASVIVSYDGLEWVWASPCALNGCTPQLALGHEGFEYATAAQWARKPPKHMFYGKCASPWFDIRYNHCDQIDLDRGSIGPYGLWGSAPQFGMPAGDDGTLEMHPVGETFLVRVGTIIVDLDVKPGSADNPVNISAGGVTPVAVLTRPDFDALSIDRVTVAFGPAGIGPAHASLGHEEDVDGDGDVDLVMHFTTKDIGLSAGDTEVCISGKTLGGNDFEGCDAVSVKENKGKK